MTCNSCILHAWKTNTNSWRTSRSATSSSCSQAPLDYSCSGFWVLGQLNMGCLDMAVFYSHGKVFHMCSYYYILEISVGSVQFLRCLHGIFPIVPVQSMWTLFSGASLSGAAVSLTQMLRTLMFWSNCKFFKPFHSEFSSPYSLWTWLKAASSNHATGWMMGCCVISPPDLSAHKL
jgi:hypothetical protein